MPWEYAYFQCLKYCKILFASVFAVATVEPTSRKGLFEQKNQNCLFRLWQQNIPLLFKKKKPTKSSTPKYWFALKKKKNSPRIPHLGDRGVLFKRQSCCFPMNWRQCAAGRLARTGETSSPQKALVQTAEVLSCGTPRNASWADCSEPLARVSECFHLVFG